MSTSTPTEANVHQAVTAAAGKPPQIDLGVVSRELRGVVSRRRELMTFVGSLFAAMSLFLQNVLQGHLPEGLKPLRHSIFLTYSLGLLIPSAIISLRIARLYAGMIINGVFYQRVRLEETLPRDASGRPRPPVISDFASSGRLFFFGASTQFFFLTALLASYGAVILALSLGYTLAIAAVSGGVTMIVLLLLFLYFYYRARRFAIRHALSAVVEPFTEQTMQEHLAASREDTNHDMLSVVSFVGLMLFSSLESLSGLGEMNADATEFSGTNFQLYGEYVAVGLFVLITLICAIIYLRLIYAAGMFSLRLDPTDRPFSLFKLTDSLMGYVLLIFFLTIGVHLLLFPMIGGTPWIWRADGGVLGVGLLAYALMMYSARPEKSCL